MRASELLGLSWRDVDMNAGTIRLDENKTDKPRVWTLRPDSKEALRLFRDLLGPLATTSSPLLVKPVTGQHVPAGKAAKQLREALQTAGVERDELFEVTKNRMAIRGHDLRATFVTLALAGGKSEAWISDRTGHESSHMIRRYYRIARTHFEADLGQLEHMAELIPELAELKKRTNSPMPK